MKKAEEGNEIVIRMHQSVNKFESFELIFGVEIDNVCECNMLEKETEPLAAENNRLKL